MEINVEDYLDRDEIKDIIKNQISYIVGKDAERLLTNSAYYVVFKAIDEALDNSAKEFIKAKAIAIINELSEYSVFKKKDAWGKEDSIAYQTLQEAMNENKDLIRQKVREAIKNRDYEKDIERSMDYISEGLFEIMRKGLSQ